MIRRNKATHFYGLVAFGDESHVLNAMLLPSQDMNPVQYSDASSHGSSGSIYHSLAGKIMLSNNWVAIQINNHQGFEILPVDLFAAVIVAR